MCRLRNPTSNELWPRRTVRPIRTHQPPVRVSRGEHPVTEKRGQLGDVLERSAHLRQPHLAAVRRSSFVVEQRSAVGPTVSLAVGLLSARQLLLLALIGLLLRRQPPNWRRRRWRRLWCRHCRLSNIKESWLILIGNNRRLRGCCYRR